MAAATSSPVVLVIVSIDHHHSTTYAVPSAQTALLAKLSLFDMQEIDYFKSERTDDEQAVVSLIGGEEDEEEDSPLDAYVVKSSMFPLHVVKIINISMPML